MRVSRAHRLVSEGSFANSTLLSIQRGTCFVNMAFGQGTLIPGTRVVQLPGGASVPASRFGNLLPPAWTATDQRSTRLFHRSVDTMRFQFSVKRLGKA
jgi:hypothetical protein